MSKDDEDERIYNDGLKEEELAKCKEQNDILKEKLIVERYWRLFSHLKDGMELAKDQLKYEMKDINWED